MRESFVGHPVLSTRTVLLLVGAILNNDCKPCCGETIEVTYQPWTEARERIIYYLQKERCMYILGRDYQPEESVPQEKDTGIIHQRVKQEASEFWMCDYKLNIKSQHKEFSMVPDALD
ncbi:hypothetical protein AVEN_177708-1 [Araneus ventricosus]|uniref:Uncharacterized protein n=1 Tax=Araneus ventricosus TaxID=182803 RepID=A0A4Y2QJJ8_ARAVE|nr:hypothetical protein AVEN_177708-1 [Araneus ventricosus]